MNNKSATLLTVFVVLILALSSSIISIVNSNKKESFTDAGEYPKSVEKPLLECSYNVEASPCVSCLGVEDIYTNYPTFPINSCANNNVRYWRKPTNGLCSPPELCGGLYTETEPVIPPAATPPKWDSGMRVNFYEYGLSEDILKKPE